MTQVATKEEALQDDLGPTPDVPLVPCPACRKDKWRYVVEYTTMINNGLRGQSDEEIRCANCGKKATIEIAEIIRSTPQFKIIRKQEDMYT